MRLTLDNVRISFADGLFTAKKGQEANSKAKYQSSFLFPEIHPAYKALKAAFPLLANEKWGVKGAAQLKALEVSDKLCLHNGDTKTYVGYAGNWFVSASNATRPTVRHRDGRTPITLEDGIIYSGCRVRAFIELWAQDNGFGKRINASLRGVQFYLDDERFSGGGAADEDEMTPIADADADSVMA